MDRRTFIQLTAISGASAGLASCGNPENQLIRFIPDEELVPGVAIWKPGVCPLCQAGCGMLVRVMDGEAEVVRGGRTGLIKMGLAKKLEGNPAHPINHGTLCARGQAAIQIAYHPDRVTQPLRRRPSGTRGDGRFDPISWDEAISEFVSRLDALAAAGDQRSLAFLTSPAGGPGHQRRELITEFLRRFGAPPPFSVEAFGDDVLRRANLLSFGREQLPTFDLARCRYLLAFGADFLGTWNSPVAQTVAYGAMRQGRPGMRGKFVQVEARMSQTGANADEWIAVRPGTEGLVALGLAHVMLNAGLRPPAAAGPAGALIDGWANRLPEHTPAEVERRTGVGAARLERLARELVAERPSVVIIGGAPLAHTNGVFHALAVNALNALLGSVGEPGGLSFMPQMPASETRGTAPPAPPPSLGALAAAQLAAGAGARSPVQALLIDGVNAVYATPARWRVRDALSTIPFIASFGSFIDETSVLADLILPDHSFLESWTEAAPESGAEVAVATLAPPAMRPLHQTRATPDVLLEAGRRLGRPLAPPLPWDTFEDMLRATFSSLPVPAGMTEDEAWSTVQEQGGWWGAPRSAPGASRAPQRQIPDARRGGPYRFADAQFDGDAGQYPFFFLPYVSQAFLDGSLAHLPWLQELPDALSTAMWSSWVEINPQTAARLAIGQGDLVEVKSAHGELRAPALVSPGLAPDVIAMPAGQGHDTFTRYASGRGANPIKILAPLTEPDTGALAWAATRVAVSRVADGRGALVLFAGSLTERPHEREGR